MTRGYGATVAANAEAQASAINAYSQSMGGIKIDKTPGAASLSRLDSSITRTVSAAAQVGIVSKETVDASKGLVAAMELTLGILGMYSVYRAIVGAQALQQAALLAADIARAAANPLTWPNIAVAGAAGVATYAAVRSAAPDINVSLPGININDPSQRRMAADQVRGYSSG